MKYHTETWIIKDLVDLYNRKKLNLNPPYQRNFIWSLKDQRELLDSIVKKLPLPNFFLLKRKSGRYEVVDGQQRIRTIFGFLRRSFTDFKEQLYSIKKFPKFLNYEITVTVIDKVLKSEGVETIEKFYARVNKTGKKLNKPELRKAEFYDTDYLLLINNLASLKEFQDLELFSESSINRMNDIDLISELVTLLFKGITDKKITVDQAFRDDITSSQYENLENKFKKVLRLIHRFNSIYPINKTRYKQRADFYTLFGFVNDNIHISRNTFFYFYKLLVLIGTGNDISPSNDQCLTFKHYAINCVTQSNSKAARKERLNFFNEFLLNKNKKLNDVQLDILDYYELSGEDMTKVGPFRVIDIGPLMEIKEIYF